MPDTLSTIHLIAGDSDMLGRLNASAAQERAPGDPISWVWARRYQLASAPGWAAAVDSWLAANPDAEPSNGWANDQAVISDTQVTAQVQAVLSEDAES